MNPMIEPQNTGKMKTGNTHTHARQGLYERVIAGAEAARDGERRFCQGLGIPPHLADHLASVAYSNYLDGAREVLAWRTDNTEAGTATDSTAAP